MSTEKVDYQFTIITQSTKSITPAEVLSTISKTTYAPSLRTVEALMNHRGVILVGPDEDIYKVIFVMEDYRAFRIELKSNQFASQTLGTPKRDYIASLCDSPLSRVEMSGFPHADIHNWVKSSDFQQRRISLKEAKELLSNCHPKMPMNEELRQFCLKLM